MRSFTICARFFNATHEFHVLLIEWNISRVQYIAITFIELLVICIRCLIPYSQCSAAVEAKWCLWSYTLELNCWPYCVIHRSYYIGTVFFYVNLSFSFYDISLLLLCSGVIFHVFISRGAGVVSTQLCERLTPKRVEYYYYYFKFWKIIMFSVFVNSSDLKSASNISQ